MIFNLVFFIAVTSVLVQGTGLPYVAKWLHLTVPGKAKRRTGNDLEWIDAVKSVMEEVVLPPDAAISGEKIVQINFPKTATILVIKRDDEYISPVGSTSLAANDRLLILAEDRKAFSQAVNSLKIN